MVFLYATGTVFLSCEQSGLGEGRELGRNGLLQLSETVWLKRGLFGVDIVRKRLTDAAELLSRK